MAEEEMHCLEGIKKCDEFLKNWQTGLAGGPADKAPPDEVAREFRLVVFWANAKSGFIQRLAKIREREHEVPVG